MKSMLLSLYQRYVRPFRTYILITLLFVAVVSTLTSNDDAADLEVKAIVNLVETATPAQLNNNQSVELIGVVAAKTQAGLLSEVGGRVTSVNVSLGQTVSAGTVIATLENSAQSAVLLQAEGAYEAALAGSQQGLIGVTEAENSFLAAQNASLSAYKAAYNTNNTIVIGTIDQFFGNPFAYVPGLRINGRGYTTYLNEERVKLQKSLPLWQQKTESTKTTDNLNEIYLEAKSATQNLIDIVDTFISVLQKEDSTLGYTDAEIQLDLATFGAARTSLNTTIDSLDRASSALTAALEAKNRADIAGGSSNNYSTADAQVKQALGSLRAAQSNYAKTIIRTPIAGQVNTLSIKTGDYLSAFAPVAQIANNQGLEITTYIGVNERDLITIGDNLILEGNGTGTVTNVSPVVDNQTGKIEVRVAVVGSGFQNGDTVRLFVPKAKTQTLVETQIPLSSVKFDGPVSYVFLVESELLKRQDVELGTIRGERVTISSGIDLNTKIVVDARGLVEGTKVTEVSK